MSPRVIGFLTLAVSLLIIIRLMWGVLTAPPRTRRRGANAHFNRDGSAKRSYSSVSDAAAAAVEYEHDFGQHMNPYRCADGKHWHIGHAR